MKVLFILLSLALLGGIMNGCKAGGIEKNEPPEDEMSSVQPEKAHNKPYYDEWIDYTAEELQNIFGKHEEAFLYIAQVLTSLEAKTNFRIVIESKERRNLLFLTLDDGAMECTDGLSLGYVKDEIFEKYVNEILIDEKLSRIYSSAETSRLIFGRGYPIWYDPTNDTGYKKNTETRGTLAKHWFYNSQNPYNINRPGKPYYDDWIEYMAEELQSIFWEHEEAFDYIAKVVLSLDQADFHIVVDVHEKRNLMFYSADPSGLSYSDNQTAINNYTDGSDFGYVKDELFEQYIGDILVGEHMYKIQVSKGTAQVSFGRNYQIYYNENRPAFEVDENEDEDPRWGGKLKNNWFYHIQSYV